MDDKNKAVDTTTDQGASTDETKQDGSDDSTVDSVDYKAELEKEQTKRKQAEHVIEELKKQKKVDNKDADGEGVAEKVSQEVRKATDEIRSSLVQDIIDQEISKLSDNADEQKLIRFNYDNKIVKGGLNRSEIVEDLLAAHALANKKKLEKKVGEMRQAAISEKTKNSKGSASGQVQERTDANISDTEKAWVKRTAIQLGIPEEKVMQQLLKNKNSARKR